MNGSALRLFISGRSKQTFQKQILQVRLFISGRSALRGTNSSTLGQDLLDRVEEEVLGINRRVDCHPRV